MSCDPEPSGESTPQKDPVPSYMLDLGQTELLIRQLIRLGEDPNGELITNARRVAENMRRSIADVNAARKEAETFNWLNGIGLALHRIDMQEQARQRAAIGADDMENDDDTVDYTP